jgi:hypothetical protein
MLLYKTTYQVKRFETLQPEVTTFYRWHGSAKEAGAFRKISRQKYGYIPNSIQTAKIVVPTLKVDLIKFLNSDFMKLVKE